MRMDFFLADLRVLTDPKPYQWFQSLHWRSCLDEDSVPFLADRKRIFDLLAWPRLWKDFVDLFTALPEDSRSLPTSMAISDHDDDETTLRLCGICFYQCFDSFATHCSRLYLECKFASVTSHPNRFETHHTLNTPPESFYIHKTIACMHRAAPRQRNSFEVTMQTIQQHTYTHNFIRPKNHVFFLLAANSFIRVLYSIFKGGLWKILSHIWNLIQFHTL